MDRSNIKTSVLNILKGLLFSLVFSVVAVLILAIIAKYAPMSDGVVTAINQVIKVVALFFGILIGFKRQKLGVVAGLIVGLCYTLLSFAIFSLVSGELDFKELSVFDFLIGLGAGAASGILAVNLKGLKRKTA
ncbi:MAG: TIGR04086 family membrane protein [Clostridia bacterium]|nr:TIGR04086 family membrane protein [Clostridia bacterium]